MAANSNMEAMETQKFLGEFINLYQSHHCLWRHSSKDYRNRAVKDRAYATLIDKLREIDPRADKNSVMRKINAMRTSFRREHKKVRRSQMMHKKKYVPSLWYYNQLKFVVDGQGYSEPLQGVTVVDWPVADANNIDDQIDDMHSDTAMDFFEDTQSIDLSSSVQIKTEPQSSASSPILADESREQQAAVSSFQEEPSVVVLSSRLARKRSQSLEQHETESADLDRFAGYVASKLKRSSIKQSIIAEKVIAEVLMRANLGTLEETTVLSDFKPHPS